MNSCLTNEEAQNLALLWAKSEPIVRVSIIANLGNCDQVDDLLQEVAAAAAAQFSVYDHDRPFTAWVLGITRKRIAMFYRTQSRNRHVFSSEAMERVSAVAGGLSRSTYDTQLSALRACIRALVGRGKQIIEMRYERGWRVQKIASELGMSRVAVSGILHRARNGLKRCIEKKLRAEQ